MNTRYFLFLSLLGVALLTACGKDRNHPGYEFAPQMYVSKAYEGYTQVEGQKNKFNPFGMNMRLPAKNTVARRTYNTVFSKGDSTGQTTIRDLMVYNIGPNDLVKAEKELANPVPLNQDVLKDGEVLYLQYCAPCHGEVGDGQGKVGKVYKGVANYAGITKNAGHIFHVITYGKGRMWPHGSQLNPEERWKVVHYVNKLQDDLNGGSTKEEKKDDKKVEEKKEEKKAEAKKEEKKEEKK
jgi:mono/diheme cytochrome c family protein